MFLEVARKIRQQLGCERKEHPAWNQPAPDTTVSTARMTVHGRRSMCTETEVVHPLHSLLLPRGAPKGSDPTWPETFLTCGTRHPHGSAQGHSAVKKRVNLNTGQGRMGQVMVGRGERGEHRCPPGSNSLRPTMSESAQGGQTSKEDRR